jgi:tetratricopeptide (TPR) repeat protein
MVSAPPKPLHALQVFVSYAHEDENLCQEFLTHLSQLKHDGLLQDWHDRRITGGSEWAGRIDEHLNSADIIVLLVSPDFLASSYCYDVEMKRALQRDEAGEARVVPVILRPCDWQTSPFSRLDALPKDGKPVVDWKTHDHGYLNVVEGLRQVADELRPPAEPILRPDVGRAPRRPPVRRIHPWQLVFAGGLIVLIMAAGWLLWTRHSRRAQERQLIAQGEDLLNIGRYDAAREPFAQALRLNPGSAKANIGLQIGDLVRVRSDAVDFERRLKRLLKEAPHDAHLKVLEGDYLVGQGQPDEAMRRYEEATGLNQDLAEAYFRLGVLYDQRRDIARAMRMFQRAAELAPSSPHYACNLADQYFKHGEYQEAIAVYGRIRQFPLAALESAKIYRLLGELKAAAEQERIAIDWLGQPSVANSPENLLPWSLEWGRPEPLSLPTEGEKLCYAQLQLSATLYLDRDEAQAKGYSDRAMQACGSRSYEVRKIVQSELERLARERDDLAGRAETYQQRFLLE